jgi:hypothetical protein
MNGPPTHRREAAFVVAEGCTRHLVPFNNRKVAESRPRKAKRKTSHSREELQGCKWTRDSREFIETGLLMTCCGTGTLNRPSTIPAGALFSEGM